MDSCLMRVKLPYSLKLMIMLPTRYIASFLTDACLSRQAKATLERILLLTTVNKSSGELSKIFVVIQRTDLRSGTPPVANIYYSWERSWNSWLLIPLTMWVQRESPSAIRSPKMRELFSFVYWWFSPSRRTIVSPKLYGALVKNCFYSSERYLKVTLAKLVKSWRSSSCFLRL